MRSSLPAILASIALALALPPFTSSITPASLRGIVSFLASDALQGRDTPSPGLDAAGAYIAAAFRADGLESSAGDDYSQYADFVQVSGSVDTLQFSLSGTTVPAASISVESLEAAHLVNEPVFKWAPNVNISGPLNGRILMLRATSDREAIAKLELSHPDAIVQLSRDAVHGGWRKGPMLRAAPAGAGARIVVPASGLESIFDRLPNGETAAKATLTIPTPTVKTMKLRNIIGVLPGSDPRLRDEYLLITAHYDHLGVSEAGIFSGANDNASGVAAVLSLAAAFASETPHPKRTLMFVAFFGEEKGLLGSAWFARHPPVPLSRIVADINFEQLGDSGADRDVPPSTLGVTGYSLSTLPELVSPALASAGVSLRNTSGNIEYFGRSDNYPLALAGIPSHTFVAAYEYPDYHRVSDKWQKLDYENMAKLTRALAVAIESVADNSEGPHWIESSKTKGYVEAWRATHR